MPFSCGGMWWYDAVALSAASPLPWSRSLERMIEWPQGSSRVRVQVKECLMGGWGPRVRVQVKECLTGGAQG